MAGEANLHRSLRNWAYGKWGEIDVERKTGCIKIIKQSMLAQYGEAGAADWVIHVKGRYTFFIELKNPDGSGECTEKQLRWHAQMRALGYNVYVVDNLVVGKRVMETEINRALGKHTPAAKRRPLAYG
jgi:hypothetical protein